MREIRLSGSEGGGTPVLPTPIPPGHYYMRPGHYYIGLLQIGLLLLKNHSYFPQNRYSHPQAAILRGTFHRFFRGRDSMKWNEGSCR